MTDSQRSYAAASAARAAGHVILHEEDAERDAAAVVMDMTMRSGCRPIDEEEGGDPDDDDDVRGRCWPDGSSGDDAGAADFWGGGARFRADD